MAQPLPIFLGNGCATASEKPFHLFLQGQGGFDHGVGHPLLLLCGTKVSNYRKNKEFNDLGHYSEWPKVADAVIKAKNSSSQRWRGPRAGRRRTRREPVREVRCCPPFSLCYTPAPSASVRHR